jgi:hypothetical protein
MSSQKQVKKTNNKFIFISGQNTSTKCSWVNLLAAKTAKKGRETKRRLLAL